ncbi:chemotaxis protein CheB [Thioclava sp. SK-1]|uniref:CheR family methyltransferase n=1 Tax=Thioclava sp. SK-1 TaxID=1889770 RepID=UPI0008261B80|nr:CheR family methyltransferase [Thioclava sp. SK-1]OCX60987.1 chemotaxis protein CheB [Thioclava sp. SK-1]
MNTQTQHGRLGIVGVGASAGGLDALRAMLNTADPAGAISYVIVQHLDPDHSSLLAELLARQTRLKVVQAQTGDIMCAGKVFIIPPNHGLRIANSRLELTDLKHIRGVRRTIDEFLESLAVDQGSWAAGVILSGTGTDGSRGLRSIKEHGGICIAQHGESAKHDGMPLAAQRTGSVDYIRLPEDICPSLEQYFAAMRRDPGDQSQIVAQSLSDICAVVDHCCGHDFSQYKRSTLIRRVLRRMQLSDLSDPLAYLRSLRSDVGQCQALYQDLLINMTRFFRDTAYFDALHDQVLRPMVQGAQRDLRLWVAGCSSGEEAYSIAMLVAEEIRVQQRKIDFQIFATDIDDTMLNMARAGQYSLSALPDIPETLRDRYAVLGNDVFTVSEAVRSRVRFSHHSVVRDAPFAEVDLISCRNLLIYFETNLQNLAFPAFHHALRTGGTLFLGSSETLGQYESFFAPIDVHARLFRKVDAQLDLPVLGQQEPRPIVPKLAAVPLPAQKADPVLSRLLQAYAPPSLRVNHYGEVIRATGKLSKYLAATPEPRETVFATSVALPGVREPISAAVRKVNDTGRRVILRDLIARSEFGHQAFELIAEPVGDDAILLVFRERDRFAALDDDDLEEFQASDDDVRGLEDDLRETRDRLNTTVEELETANEELKSSNEEMMSMNEELQSTNEELATVNDELKSKVDELSVANADLSNFFSSTSLPLIVLDRAMRIRNFTNAIDGIYPFRQGDRGRPLSEVTSKLANPADVTEAVELVMSTSQTQHRRVRSLTSGQTWSLVVTPYFRDEDTCDGATLVFTELTEALRLEAALRSEGERLRLALDVANMGVWEFNPADDGLQFDDTAARLLWLKNNTVTVSDFFQHVTEKDRPEVMRQMLLKDGEDDEIDFRFSVDHMGQARTLHFVGRRVSSARETRYLGVLFDVTAEDEAVRIREMMLREMNHRVKNMFSIISGMIRIAGRSTREVPQLVEGIERRINALARSHDMTQRAAKGRHMKVTLNEVLSMTLSPYVGHSKIEMDGPEVSVESHDLTALSLIFHEWATNASKYGVLGPLTGDLMINWQKNGEEITLEWNETYEARIEPVKTTAGFGSTLVQLSAAQLHGSVSTDTSLTQRRMILTYEPELAQ